MKDTTNRRGAQCSECISHSSCCPTTGQGCSGRPHRLADLIAQFVSGLDRDKAEDYVRDRVAYRVERLADKCHLDESQQDDLSQDFLLMVVQAIPRYDAARAKWKTFVCRVLNRRYRHILRGLMATENGAPAEVGFDDLGDDAEEAVLDPTTTSGDSNADDDLRIDMAAAISAMPERLQLIARLLMVHSPSEVARILGTSPAAITRAIARIRMHFKEAGLE